MGETRGTRWALGTLTVLILLFLFIPIVLIVVYAFNPQNVQSWPPPGLSTKWFSPTWHNHDARDAFVLSVKAAFVATALVAGGLLAFALSFDEVIVTTFTAGAQNTLPLWIFGAIRLGQQLPEVNVAVLIVMAITVVPVVLAQRLTRDTGVLRQGR